MSRASVFRAAERRLRRVLPREWRRMWRRNAAGGRFFSRVATPEVANEKYLWRKLVDHDPRFVICSDKLATKAWVASLGLPVEIPRVLWVSEDPATLPDELISPEVILKVNHGSRMNLDLSAGRPVRDEVVKTLSRHLATDFGRKKGEWSYLGIRRRAFAEERRSSPSSMIDLKFFTFGPVVEEVMPIYHDGHGSSAAVWMREPGSGRMVPSARRAPAQHRADTRPLPGIVEQATEVAAAIGAFFDHMRVDLMSDGERLFLGELTVYNLGGKMIDEGHLPHAPSNRSWDLRRSWFLNRPQDGWRAEYAEALREWLDERAAGDPYLSRVPPIEDWRFDLRYEDFAPE